MKAIVITSPGGPEVLQLQEVQDPQIKDDEVLIKVHATALNRADTLQRKGSYPPPQGASPYLGLECSGIVESVGKNVSKWKIGDQVYSFFDNLDMGFSLYSKLNSGSVKSFKLDCYRLGNLQSLLSELLGLVWIQLESIYFQIS